MSSARKHLLSIPHQRQVFGEVARTHGLDPLIAASWYNIRADEVSNIKDIKDILHAYKHSFVNALLRIFPNIGLEKDKLIAANVAGVTLQEKQRLIRELARQLGYSSKYEDLYKLSSQKFRHNGLRYLILPHNDSSVRLITSTFPEHVWHEWLFEHPPLQLWNDKKIHKRYTDWLGDKLGIKDMEGWYGVSVRQVHHNRGKTLLNLHYNDSLVDLLRTVHPTHNWHEWLFRDGVPADYWKSSENCRRYLEWLGKRLSFNHQEDWYKITNKNLEDNQGRSLLEQFNRNAAQVVMSTFDTHAWDMELMASRTVDFAKPKEVLDVLGQVARRVHLQTLSEWYVVTTSDLFAVPFGRRMYKYYRGDMLRILQTAYPNHAWDASKFSRNTKNKRQFLLEIIIRELFKGYTVLTNARKDTQMKFEHGNQPYMELDIYLPDLHLAFEYQDPHHYFFMWYANKPLETYQKRDQMKVQAAKSRGITLIHIPFWWDGSKESVIGTILKERSELLQRFTSSEPNHHYPTIPTDPPQQYEQHSMLKDYYVPGIGVPMLASPLMSFEDFDGKDWWMIEKFDGIRAFWSPVDGQLLSRSGRSLQLPPSLLAESFIPIKFWLDGEIWFGYGRFDEAGKVAHKAALIEWSSFKYIAFDAPSHEGTYEERYEFLQQFLVAIPRVIVPLYYKCSSTDNLLQFTQGIIDKGGEGVILRNPKSTYTHGRSQEFLKLKKFRDAEARVTAIDQSSYTCEMPNKLVFSAPVEASMKKKHSIQEGTIVSFKHRGFARNGKPKLPMIYRIRTDVHWKDLQASAVTTQLEPIELKPRSRLTPSSFNEYAPHLHKVKGRKPLGFWNEAKNVRDWFDHIARTKGFDPAANIWNHTTLAELRSTKGGSSLSRKYGTLRKAFQVVYPNALLHSPTKQL